MDVTSVLSNMQLNLSIGISIFLTAYRFSFISWLFWNQPPVPLSVLVLGGVMKEAGAEEKDPSKGIWVNIPSPPWLSFLSPLENRMILTFERKLLRKFSRLATANLWGDMRDWKFSFQLLYVLLYMLYIYVCMYMYIYSKRECVFNELISCIYFHICAE